MHLLFWTALAAFVIDQVSKYLVVHVMELSRVGAIDVLPPLLNFRYGENRGINFGLLDGQTDLQRWLLVGFSVLLVAGVIFWIWRAGGGKRMQVCAGLLAGGALGNVVDRVIYGYVLDFLNMSCCGFNNPFVFNVADAFIFAGAIGLVFFDGRAGAKKAP